MCKLSTLRALLATVLARTWVHVPDTAALRLLVLGELARSHPGIDKHLVNILHNHSTLVHIVALLLLAVHNCRELLAYSN